jgi:hypothetical protein
MDSLVAIVCKYQISYRISVKKTFWEAFLGPEPLLERF